MGLNPKAMRASRWEGEPDPNLLAIEILMDILTLRRVKRTKRKESKVIKIKKYLILLVILMTLTSPAFSAAVYKVVDHEGIANFADDLGKVPDAYRIRVDTDKVSAWIISTGTA